MLKEFKRKREEKNNFLNFKEVTSGKEGGNS